MPTRTCVACGKQDELKYRIRSDKCLSCANKGTVRHNYRAKKIKSKYRMWSIEGKRVYAHRAVMEAHLGRKLRPEEIVHHIDGDGHNNAIENLELTTNSAHMRHHTTERNENEQLHVRAANIRWGNI